MRIILFSLITFVLTYVTIATYYPIPSLMGQIGYLIPQYTYKYFGYMAFLLPLMYIYLSYDLILKNSNNKIIKVISSHLILTSYLLIQATQLNEESKMLGEVGKYINQTLEPLIGSVGVIMLGLSGVVVTGFVITKFFVNVIKNIINSKIVNYFLKLLSKIKIPKIVIPKINKKIKQENIIVFQPEENLLQKTSKDKNDKEVKKQIKKNGNFKISTSFFQSSKQEGVKEDKTLINKNIEQIIEKLKQFNIEGKVVNTYTGPIVTTYEFKPAPNVKVSKILNLQDDLCMALKVPSIRIQAPIPGKDVVGIELPNKQTETIYIRDLLESNTFKASSSPLTMILGKDIFGNPYVTDLKKLPHLLIAGTTGSGKSVGINSMIISLLYKNNPQDLKMIMIDPKMLEFTIYSDIPHLLTPVITKPREAINALANTVKEMERRYELMANTKTKNIENFNEKAPKIGEEKMPYIVVVIDELADLMMTSGKEVELNIARLAQMARASGIHLIVATQRPSVDVVTGLIKANLPSRLSYKVGQKVDSKIILDQQGAESLLGRGDLLFTPPGSSDILRAHAPWSQENEIEEVVNYLKDQQEVQYDLSFLKEVQTNNETSVKTETVVDKNADVYEQAKQVVIQDRKSSISYLQRKLRVGYNKAATLVERLEEEGVLSAPNVKGTREILVEKEE